MHSKPVKRESNVLDTRSRTPWRLIGRSGQITSWTAAIMFGWGMIVRGDKISNTREKIEGVGKEKKRHHGCGIDGVQALVDLKTPFAREVSF